MSLMGMPPAGCAAESHSQPCVSQARAWLIAGSLAVFPHLACAPIDAIGGVLQDGLVAAEIDRSLHQPVAATLKLGPHLLSDAALDLHPADPVGRVAGR